MKQVRALVIGVGCPAFRGVRHMLLHNPDQVPVRIVGTDVHPDAAEQINVDRFYVTPRADDPEFVSCIVDICSRERIDVVIVENDLEMHAMAGAVAELEAVGATPLVSSATATRQASDKAELLTLFAKLDLPHPAYRLVGNVEQLKVAALELGYPERELAIKPANQCGGRGFCIVSEQHLDPSRFFAQRIGSHLSVSQLEEVLAKGQSPQLLLMEYLSGDEYSVDAFVGEHIQVAIPRVRVRLAGGIGVAAKTKLEYRQDLIDYTLQAAEALDLRYTFGMQFRLDSEGMPRILECNPRVHGTIMATAFSGVNLIWLAVREAMGEPVTELPNQLKTASFTRGWGGIAQGPNWHVTI